MNKAVSDYMRDMQRRSAKSRWGGMSAAEKSAAMKVLRAKAKRKPKRVARRSNTESSYRSGPVATPELKPAAQSAHSD